MKRFILGLVTFVLTLTLTMAVLPTWATARQNLNQQIPEIDGTYDEPSHPNLKVRVIVHHAKTDKHGKPGGSTPTLVCGLTDPDSDTVVPAAGWKLPSAWTYRLNPSSVPSSVGGTNLATIATNGFGDWHTASGNKVSFTQGPDTLTNRQAYDGQNIIAWGRTSGSALAVTYIRYNTVTKVAVDVDTIVNKSFLWYWSPTPDCAYSGVYDAEDILTHELGHWIGMDDSYDSSYQNNTMFGYGSIQEVKKNTLTTGDNAGAYQIYNP